MGRLILCAKGGGGAPFVFQDSGMEVYTLEEMCYYIYNNIDVMSDEVFDRAMVKWLFEQEGLGEVAKKMTRLLENGNSLKDKIVTLLCGCDYYREEEIRALIQELDQIENMSYLERCRRKGARLLKNGGFKEAEVLFQSLLREDSVGQLTAEEYGDVLHNLAVAHTHTTSYREAAREFKEAYGRNHRRESMEQYFIALKLSEQEQLYEKELAQMGAGEELKERIERAIESKKKEAEELPDYKMVKELPALKESGQVSAYYEAIGKIIGQWKQEYREAVR